MYPRRFLVMLEAGFGVVYENGELVGNGLSGKAFKWNVFIASSFRAEL
jgi:hypothetical protein